MKHVVIVIAATIAVVCGLGALVAAPDLGAVFGLPNNSFAANVGVVSCSVSRTAAAKFDLDKDQLGHATAIFEVAMSMDAGERGAVIGIATAMQESTLHNYGHLGESNDHDSLGLFQQRPSKGWGTPDQVTDPQYAATSFYERLKKVVGWRSMPLTQAAQAVQRSAFPDAYAKWEAPAADIAKHLSQTCAEDWIAPLKAGIVSGFHTDDRPDHDGIDLGASRGTNIKAASNGIAITVQCDASSPDGSSYSCDSDGGTDIAGCGWYVDIRHRDATMTRYCHMAEAPLVEEGQEVTAGQKLGIVGSSGNSSGPHLHFETHQGCDTTNRTDVSGCVPTNPVAFLEKKGVEL